MDPEGLPGGEQRVEGVLLRAVSRRRGRRPAAAARADREGARRRPERARQHAEGGGLAGAVQAQPTEALPGKNDKI